MLILDHSAPQRKRRRKRRSKEGKYEIKGENWEDWVKKMDGKMQNDTTAKVQLREKITD